MLLDLDFWSGIRCFYQEGTFCDLEMVPKDSKVSLKCHQLVMASVSTVLRSTLTTTSHDVLNDSVITVMMPDVSFDELQQMIDSIYDFLAGSSVIPSLTEINPVLTKVFGLLAVPKIFPAQNMAQRTLPMNVSESLIAQ